MPCINNALSLVYKNTLLYYFYILLACALQRENTVADLCCLILG